MSDLRGKRVLVTGAAGGLGLECVRMFAEAGAAVAMADVQEERLRDAAAGLPESADPVVLPVDIRVKAQCEQMVELACESLGGLDVFVGSAGIHQSKDFLELSEADWRSVIDVNLTGAFYCLQASGRKMMDGGGGSIVLFSSIAGRRGRAASPHYAASKAA